MAELLGDPERPTVAWMMSKTSRMRLYCWPCRTVHEFDIADVERIVYALGADAAEDSISSCLLEVVRWADDIEVYAEHVEQGVECRTLDGQDGN